MNITSLIKITTAVAAITASSLLSSCIQPIGQQQAAAQNQVQQASAAATNPYAVPGLNGQVQQAPPVAAYPQNNVPAPYQPLPGVPSDIPNIQTPEPTPSIGTTNQSTTASTHAVVAGESLWRISRKYGVTVDALKQANNLNNDNIWAGQKLNIPAGN